MALFATVDDVKAHLNKVSSADNAELQAMIDAASDVVAAYVGRSFDAETVTERVDVRGGRVLLSRRPVAGDVTLTAVPGAVLSGYDVVGGAVSGYTVNRAAGVVYDVIACGPLTATYQVAGAVVPPAVKLATAVIVAHLWETQRGTAPSALQLQGAAEDFPLTPGLGFAIPNRAKELLEPFVRRSQMA